MKNLILFLVFSLPLVAFSQNVKLQYHVKKLSEYKEGKFTKQDPVKEMGGFLRKSDTLTLRVGNDISTYFLTKAETTVDSVQGYIEQKFYVGFDAKPPKDPFAADAVMFLRYRIDNSGGEYYWLSMVALPEKNQGILLYKSWK